MATTVKTAISMQEDLFKKVNKLAKELHISRSKLFALAVQEFIKQKENQTLLSQINDAFDDFPDTEEAKLQQKMREKQANNLEAEAW